MEKSDTLKEKFEWVKEFWQYRELLYFFVWRDLKVKYKQTVLGALWAIIQPFCTMVVFTIFFGKLAKMPSDGIPYPVFSYSALVPWTYFTTSLASAGNCLIGNSNLLTKVYFPRVSIPVASVLSGLIDFMIASLLLGVVMLYFNVPITWELIFWPVLVIPLALLALGLGMLLAALNVQYRDVKYTIPFALSLLMYLTPIIYPLSIVPEKYRFWMSLNPLTGIIETYRSIVTHNKEVNFTALGISFIVIIVIFFIGLSVFQSTEKKFADII
ncbi:MAG: ABC transporter permease [Deltaproteobacteria bacterium]|nr:ABC transporter permease [Deltaproteobacteria bacterium]